MPIWPRSGQAAVVRATLTMTSPFGLDPDVVHHPEVDDRGPQLGVEDPGQHAPDVVGARERGAAGRGRAGIGRVGGERAVVRHVENKTSEDLENMPDCEVPSRKWIFWPS